MQPLTKTIHTDWTTLIERARGGCDIALGELLESVRDYLLLVAESKLGFHVRSKFGASDIVQLSMLEAQNSLGEFRGCCESEFRQWIKQIVLHNLTDQARLYTHTHSRRVNLEVPEETLASYTSQKQKTPSWNARCREFDQQLAQAVAQLPNRQRYVVEARHKYGLDYPEIAAQLEISEASARKIWSRAAKQLRSLLEPPQ